MEGEKVREWVGGQREHRVVSERVIEIIQVRDNGNLGQGGSS